MDDMENNDISNNSKPICLVANGDTIDARSIFDVYVFISGFSFSLVITNSYLNIA